MTAQLDHWATTDHDPTSHTEAIRHLTLITAQPLPPPGPTSTSSPSSKSPTTAYGCGYAEQTATRRSGACTAASTPR